MPLTLLSEMPLDTYGQYRSTPTPEQLSKFFHLDTADLALLNNRRRDHNRLGMAVQLCTLRAVKIRISAPASETVPPRRPAR